MQFRALKQALKVSQTETWFASNLAKVPMWVCTIADCLCFKLPVPWAIQCIASTYNCASIMSAAASADATLLALPCKPKTSGYTLMHPEEHALSGRLPRSSYCIIRPAKSCPLSHHCRYVATPLRPAQKVWLKWQNTKHPVTRCPLPRPLNMRVPCMCHSI